MNILVFSEAAWDDKNSFGNTVSNFFSGDAWKEDTFCNFYARNQMPDNQLNVNYYNLSAVDILRGMLKGEIKGRRFSTIDLETQKKSLDEKHVSEKKNIDKLHQKPYHFIYFVHEAIWMSRVWLNRSFKCFVEENCPDVLFAFAASPYILWPLIRYLKKNTYCKVVLLAADEVYGGYDRLPAYRKGYLKKLLGKCLLAADKVYGISDELSARYRDRFKLRVTTLYKGCDLSEAPKQALNQPLKMVYAGNLLWGRADTLSCLAHALEKINNDGLLAQLEIYTGTTITQELARKLDVGSSSKIMGAKPYAQIKKIMHDADITIHVESFEQKQIDLVKYSFSTKIIDCLQSGTVPLAIGPAETASIAYMKKIPGAIVIDQLTGIEKTVTKIIDRKEELVDRAKCVRRFAREKHEIHAVQDRLRREISSLIKT